VRRVAFWSAVYLLSGVNMTSRAHRLRRATESMLRLAAAFINVHLSPSRATCLPSPHSSSLQTFETRPAQKQISLTRANSPHTLPQIAVHPIFLTASTPHPVVMRCARRKRVHRVRSRPAIRAPAAARPDGPASAEALLRRWRDIVLAADADDRAARMARAVHAAPRPPDRLPHRAAACG
jgi:hypothetical protein